MSARQIGQAAESIRQLKVALVKPGNELLAEANWTLVDMLQALAELYLTVASEDWHLLEDAAQKVCEQADTFAATLLGDES